MKIIRKHILITAFLVVISGQLSAQTIINHDNSRNNRVYARAGVDPATLITLGYEHKLRLTILRKHPVAFAEWEFSIANLNNSEIKMGGILPLLETGDFKIVNNLNLSVGTLSAKNFKSRKFALADEVAIGWYKPKWFLAFTAEYEKIYLNYLKHSDFYKETYFEDVVDGWYNGAGGMFQFGIEGGRTFNEKYDLHLELKMPFTEKLNAYNGSPAHINLGVGYRF